MIYLGFGLGIVITILAIVIYIHVEHNRIFNTEKKEINFPNGINIELKSCPYCGGNHEILIESNTNNVPVYAIRCDSQDGGCGSQTGFYDKAIDAVLAWNIRVGEIIDD